MFILGPFKAFFKSASASLVKNFCIIIIYLLCTVLGMVSLLQFPPAWLGGGGTTRAGMTGMTIQVEIKYFCHKAKMKFCAAKGSLITLGTLKGRPCLCASFTTPFRAIKNLCSLLAAQDSLLPNDNAFLSGNE